MMQLLPSFKNFAVDGSNEKLLFTICLNLLHTHLITLPRRFYEEGEENGMQKLELYNVYGTYILDVRNLGNEKMLHRLIMSQTLKSIHIYLDENDKYAGNALSSMIRFVFSQAIICEGGFSVHASAIIKDNKGYLFLGKSGTGKSTHSQLWMKYMPNVELLNDDNPILKLMKNGTVRVFGSPWSGKTPCYKNTQVEVGGIVRLQQAKGNCYEKYEDYDAFLSILVSCAVLKNSNLLYEKLCDTIEKIITDELIKTGFLRCLPNEEAAMMCYKNISEQ